MVGIRRRIRLLAVAVIAATQVVAAQAVQMNPTTTGAAVTVRIEHTEGATLLASQAALIMNGTFEPIVTSEWISQVMQELVTPAIGMGYVGTAMDTPQEFWPATGPFSLTFNDSIKAGHDLLHAKVNQDLQQTTATPSAVFGYSQSAVIASVEKRLLAAEYADREDLPPIAFVMAGNPFRPNGGFLARLPILAQFLTPWTQMTATPTDTGFATYDIAHQYEMWADFPTYPLNLLADINALFGLMNHWYLPDSMGPQLRNLIPTVSLNPASPDFKSGTVIQQYGDTTYYTIPSEHLPMLYPLRWIGLGPLTDIVEPVLRVLVELGYDRTAPPGQVVRAGLFPTIDVDKLATDLSAAVAEGGVALRGLLTPGAANPVGEPAVSEQTTAAVAEPSPVATRRGDENARQARPAASLDSGSPQSRREPKVRRDLKRTAVRHPASKVASAGHRLATAA